MIEWFQSIGQWFVDYSKEIMTVVTSGNIIGFIANTAMIVKTMVGLKDNTKTSKDLKTALAENQALRAEVEMLRKGQSELLDAVNELKGLIVSNNENQSLLMTKMNATLDVQSVVYSTLKDSKSRSTVQNILTNAKLVENDKQTKLVEELEELRKKVAESQRVIVETVEKGVEKAEAIVENKVNVSRY